MRETFPEQIETDRLLLRAPREGDGAELNAAIRETYDGLHHWMAWATYVPEVAETEQRRVQARARFLAGEDFAFQAYLKTTGALVACVGLHPRDKATGRFEIGYWCRTAYQNQGYVSEAVRAMTQAAFDLLKAQRIEIHCDARNVRSRRVAERVGYHLDVTLENERITPDGQLRDTHIYIQKSNTLSQPR